MISVNINSHYLGGNLILEDINLHIPDGKVLGLVGTNGSGKSTLLRLMSGVYVPDSGIVLYDGKNATDPKVREDVFFLPDDPFYAGQTTGKGIFDTYLTFYPNLDRELYRRLLERFKLDENAHQRNFSKGMRRQFYIAIALSARPKYLLLDEAFDGLDAFTKKTVIEEINRAVEENDSTVVISSHALSELETFCDLYALIDNRTVSSQGSLEEHAAKYCRFRLAFTEAPSALAFSNLAVRDIEMKGKFVTVTIEGDSETAYAELLKLNPAVIEQEKLTFEDIFITDVKGGRQ
ncbi:MAG: ABC transporter ATP-binding protein [Clostridia bacterium]|nr:ABC transporter ATP-binding protein [Clostridia bacterium]